MVWGCYTVAYSREGNHNEQVWVKSVDDKLKLSKWKYRIFMATGIFISFVCPMVICYLFVTHLVSSGSFHGLPLPIQDCEMTSTTLRGKIIDVSGNAIPNVSILIENRPIDFSTSVKRQLQTNQNGVFGPERMAFYKCETIDFTFSANGYHSKTVSYILDYGLSYSMPEVLSITLERSS